MKKTISQSTIESSDLHNKHNYEKDRIDNTKGSDYIVGKRATDNDPANDNRPEVGKQKYNVFTAKGEDHHKDVRSAKDPFMRQQGDMPNDYFKDNYAEGYDVHPHDKGTNRDRRARERELAQYGTKEEIDPLAEEEKRTKGMQNKKKMVNEHELAKDKSKHGYRDTTKGNSSHDTHIKHNKDDNDVGDDRVDINDDLNLVDMNEYMEPDREAKKRLKEEMANRNTIPETGKKA